MKKAVFVISLLLFLSILTFAFSPFSERSGKEQNEVEIKTLQPFPYCCIHHKGPFTEIANVIALLYSSIQGQNIPPAGGMIGIYYNSPEDTPPQDLEWELGFPCDSHVSPLQPLQRKVWNFIQVATAIHVGSFESTGETYLAIFAWLEANGMEPAGPVLERYLTMPTPDTNPADMRTEIMVPFKIK